ncbi:MAG: hypothetical protein DI629_04365 [Mesorhizobium amorphae]|nr:MAG: hypothetical protein DI629_04365 [Mesorhizobium amorphae]
MTHGIGHPHSAVLPVEYAFDWFRRIVAVGCLAMGIYYWVRLIGLWNEPLWRFDLMPVHWQVAAVTLAVFLPFAAIGLWMLASWGLVIFLICAVTEWVMHLGFPALFGPDALTMGAYAAVLGLYLGFIFLISRQRQERDVSNH